MRVKQLYPYPLIAAPDFLKRLLPVATVRRHILGVRDLFRGPREVSDRCGPVVDRVRRRSEIEPKCDFYDPDCQKMWYARARESHLRELSTILLSIFRF